tara:strand:+ start:558 stop:1748 length:1191 start_codon:yes stop_codon:yes gene_type:complete
MSRILKRPMFRRGGKVNQGIMSGLVDRRNYKKGAFGNMSEDQIRSNIEMLMGLQDKFAPVAKTRLPLGEVGLALVSGAPVVDALGAGYKKFVSDDDRRRALIDKRKQAAVSTVLGQAVKTPKIPTTKKALNKTNQIINGVEPGKVGFFTNAQIAAFPGGLIPPPAQSEQITIGADGTVNIKKGDVKGETPAVKEGRQIKITTFQMNNAAQSLVSDLQANAKVGPVGSFITALDSAGAQLKQAADAFGFSTTGPDKTFDDTGSGAIDRYIEDKFGSSIGGDAAKLGRIKSVSINLAYLMARIDEPGGRFTDRDIALKMEELGIGANPQRTINVLTNAIKLRNSNAAFAYQELTGNPLDFSNMNIIGSIDPNKETSSGARGMKKIFNPLGIDPKLLAE